MDDHSSRIAITDDLKRPDPEALHGSCFLCFPIWSCSAQSFAVFTPAAGIATTSEEVARSSRSRYRGHGSGHSLCSTVPQALRPGRALPFALPYGVRTFLPHAQTDVPQSLTAIIHKTEITRVVTRLINPYKESSFRLRF